MPVILAANVENAGVLFALFIMLVSAKLLAELFERLKQPAVVGEILAGVIIGPSVLGLVEPSNILDIIAEIGVIFLLFNVGLETKPQDVLAVGKHALLVGVLGVILPFVAGIFYFDLVGRFDRRIFVYRRGDGCHFGRYYGAGSRFARIAR